MDMVCGVWNIKSACSKLKLIRYAANSASANVIMARGVKLYFLACCHVTSFSTRNFQPEHSGHKSLKKVQFVEVALFALFFVFLQWSNPEQDCGMKKNSENTVGFSI